MTVVEGLPWLADDLVRVETTLRSSVQTGDPFLTDVASHTLQSGLDDITVKNFLNGFEVEHIADKTLQSGLDDGVVQNILNDFGGVQVGEGVSVDSVNTAVLSIVNPPSDQKSVADYVAKHKIKTPIIFDCGQVAYSYAQPSTPTSTPPNAHHRPGTTRQPSSNPHPSASPTTAPDSTP